LFLCETLKEKPDNLGGKVRCLEPVVQVGIDFKESEDLQLVRNTGISGKETDLLSIKTVW
jgi:hypothetical protein